MRRACAVAACILLATSCTRDDGSGAAAGSGSTDSVANGRETGSPPTTGAQRPANLADTIMIEGMPQPVTLTLVQSPAGFPASFSTYVPPDMQSHIEPDSGVVRFTAAFGGTVRPEAYVQVQVLPKGAGSGSAASAVSADTLVARMMAGRSATGLQIMHGAPPWASDGAGFYYTEGGERYNGTIAVRSAGTTPFRVVVHMPSEYGDGMGPRVQKLFEHWRWADGTPLIP